MNRTLTLTLCALLLTLSACAVRTREYYLPIDPTLVSEGTVCGSVPWGRAQIPLAEGLSIAVDLLPLDGRVSAGLQIAIPSGMSVRFVGEAIKFKDHSAGAEYSAPLASWSVGVYGRDGRTGSRDYFPAGALLKGLGRNEQLAGADTAYLKKDLFSSSASVSAPAVQDLTMLFPALEVNGVAVGPRSVPLRLVKKTGVMTCVQ